MYMAQKLPPEFDANAYFTKASWHRHIWTDSNIDYSAPVGSIQDDCVWLTENPKDPDPWDEHFVVLRVDNTGNYDSDFRYFNSEEDAKTAKILRGI